MIVEFYHEFQETEYITGHNYQFCCQENECFLTSRPHCLWLRSSRVYSQIMAHLIFEVVIAGTGYLILRLLGLQEERPKKKRDLIWDGSESWVGLFFWVVIVGGAIALFSRYS